MVGDHLDNHHLVRTHTSSKVSIQIPVDLAGKKKVLSPSSRNLLGKGLHSQFAPDGIGLDRSTDPQKDWLNWPIGCLVGYVLVGWFSEP